jgi:HD-like signal output (HDOD) protein
MSIEQEFLEKMLYAIENDQLTLPTLPEVALRVRDAVDDPDVDVGKIVNVIAQDAALAARLIKVANSPLLRGRVQIDNLQLAVSRLGLAFVKNLVTGLAMEQMFQATSDAVDRLLRKTWEHSVEVASICHVIAAHYTNLKADQAMLAGLVHEIGVLPILLVAEETPELIENEEMLDSVIAKLHPKIGNAILKAWDFPEELALLPLEYQNFERDSTNGPDFIDLVCIANIQSYSGTSHPYSVLDCSDIPAFIKIGLEPEVQVSEVDSLAAEIGETKALFS